MSDKCRCTFCVNYDFYKWAKISECKCGCHTSDGTDGHSSLCCEFPNGLKKNNPHTDLMPSEHYHEIIKQWEKDCGI